MAIGSPWTHDGEKEVGRGSRAIAARPGPTGADDDVVVVGHKLSVAALGTAWIT